MGKTRLSWDQMLMQIADTLGGRSSCRHYHVGCVFVDEWHRIITVGYNGSPRGEPNCDEIGCAKDTGVGRARCRGAHAEINAIISCIQPKRLRGATLYSTLFPCYDCMKALVQAGVRRIVYRDEYLRRDGAVQEPEPEAWELAHRRGLEVYRYDPARDVRVAARADTQPDHPAR